MKRPQPATRRQFLRGTGAALGIPFLPSLAAASGETPPKPPLRTAFVYFPNGVWEKDWVPNQTGADYELSPSLAPLKSVKDDFSVLSGLDKKNSHGGDGHYAKTANFLTGMPVAKTTGKDISSGGVSADQLIAQHFADQTPIPSLELGTEPVISGIDSNVGYTRLYGSHISWQTATRPMAKEINPRVVYDRLFGQRNKENADKAKSYRNLLDFVMEDARDIRKRLGRDDQFKMDEYLDSVRSVEKQIEFASSNQPRSWQPSESEKALANLAPGIPSEFPQHIDLMLDLIILAFRTDSTRVASFMFANDVSGRNFSFLDGVKGSHHELSHHENNEKKIAQYQKINQWHVARFARMLEKMKAITEGDGTLLDNSMVMFGSSFSDGNRHDPDNLPILLAGKAGGAIKSGQHLAAEGQVPLCNLYQSMLKANGIELESFGDSNGEFLELAGELA
ncbi:DUF1552 domain-containing protein [Planctomycetes bacterium K23_9]|uniref:Secreted protein containing DUF1552 n=1 Tax=Stieleria marina TaxID=1930275 RepID=A0A517NQ94_9BACT|nr:hypothetical protein K239x_12380 [Planctomycetes bacterium K23_9]